MTGLPDPGADGHHAPVAVLGTGRMGASMARRLLHEGFPVVVWNRTPERAQALMAEGARVALSPAAAARRARLVITMLADGPATAGAVGGPDGAIEAMSPDVPWVQMATVGLDWTRRLAALAGRHGVAFVDAPVSGSDGPAERGQLVVLASGPEEVREQLRPAFEAIGRRTLWLGPAGRGTGLKLVLNNWLATITESMAETLALAEALELDPSLVLDAVEGGPLDAPYALNKARAMLASEFLPGFALRDALKDARLALDAARSRGIELPLTEVTEQRWERAADDGRAGDDVAAVIEAAMHERVTCDS